MGLSSATHRVTLPVSRCPGCEKALPVSVALAEALSCNAITINVLVGHPGTNVTFDGHIIIMPGGRTFSPEAMSSGGHRPACCWGTAAPPSVMN